MTSYFDKDTPDIVLRSLFNKYDVDNSGTLAVSELPQLFTDDLGLNNEEAETYTLLVDKDGSGSFSFEEFKSWMNSGEKLRNVNDSSRFFLMHKAVEMFQKYDTNDSGALDRAEFTRLHTDVGGTGQGLDAALQCLDKDSNNKISFIEFLKWLNWLDISGL